MSDSTLFPELPESPGRYEVTVTVPCAGDEGALLPAEEHAAVRLAAAAVCADGLLTAWTCKQAQVSMVVVASSRAGALAAGVAVARALGGEDGKAAVTAELVRTLVPV